MTMSSEEVHELVEMNQRLLQAVTAAQEREEWQHAYHTHVLANVSDAVIATDSSLQVTAWNLGAQRLYGWEADEIIGQPHDRVTRQAPAEPSSGQRWEQTHQDRDGRPMRVEGTTVALFDEDDRPRGFLHVVHELREGERDEVQVQPVASMADRPHEMDGLKSEFLSTVTHELRTPLNAIMGFTRLVLDQPEKGGPSLQDRAFLEMSLEAAVRLLEMIDDILRVSLLEARQARLHFETFDVATLLEQAADSVEKEAVNKGLRVLVHATPDVKIRTDRGRLLNIMVSLIGNAVKFTDKGRVEVSCAERDGLVEIVVSDTGVGLTIADRSHLFESFRQVQSTASRRFGGLGLGLHLSRKLVSLLGGGVQVESEPGHGSVFTITLPATSLGPLGRP